MYTIWIPPWFPFTETALICGGAFWKGGRDERIAAGALLLSWVAGLLFRDPRWLGTQWSFFIIDSGFLVILTGVALVSRRYWPLCAAGFQLLSVLTHIGRMVDPQMHSWAYATGFVLWTQLVLAALAVGVINAWRRDVAETEDEFGFSRSPGGPPE